MPCTLIVYWNPESDTPLIIGANRDEDLDRPAEPYTLRNGGIYCPLDVRGGTWLGMNDHGLFSSLTNLEAPHVHGMSSRGDLVLEPLKTHCTSEGFIQVAKLMRDNNYNAFNLFLVDKRKLIMVSKGGAYPMIKEAAPGLHIATRWGIDTWNVPRCRYIKETLESDMSDEIWKKLLAYHGNGTLREAVCIHVLKENYATRSSCFVRAAKDWSKLHVQHTWCAPCEADHWDSYDLELIQ